MSDTTVYDAGTVLYNATTKILRIADGENTFDNLPDIRKQAKSFSIPVNGWVSDSSGNVDFPYYYDLSVSGITTNDVIMGLVNEADMNVATSCGLYDRIESLSNKIRFRSKSVPSNAISGYWWIELRVIS